MAAFHIVLRRNAVVGNAFLFECVDSVCFLQERISDVLLVGEDLLDVAFMPSGIAGSVQNAVRFKTALDLSVAAERRF